MQAVGRRKGSRHSGAAREQHQLALLLASPCTWLVLAAIVLSPKAAMLRPCFQQGLLSRRPICRVSNRETSPLLSHGVHAALRALKSPACGPHSPNPSLLPLACARVLLSTYLPNSRRGEDDGV